MHAQQRHTGQHDAQHSEPRDQRSREERRQEHAEHVQLDDRGGAGQLVVVMAHGDRRCRHREDHDPVARGGAEQRDEVAGLGDDLSPWPSLRRVDVVELGVRHPQPEQHGRADHRHDRQDHKRADVQRLQQGSTDTTQHRSEQRGDHAAGQHERDRARAEGVVGDFTSCEAVELSERLVGADQQRAEGQQRQHAEPYAGGGDESAQNAEHGAEHEPRPTSSPGHPCRGRERGDGGAQEHACDRHRRQFRAARDLRTRQAADRHDQHRRRLEEGLSGGKNEDLPMHGLNDH